ncbi:MAG: UDP-glucuronosyl/UDP-glucosyltransferase [Fibrobacteres bacterium]|nr:UDP-glucuronosyl/UDP-glucosyltransferase [Fibrobacterota bacterium]
MPFDGHFNPLTGIAMHLKERGHDVRWYTGPSYAARLAKLNVPHFPFQRATEVNAENITELYPEYSKLGTGPKAIEFALTRIFFSNLETHFHDIRELRAGFPFDAFICDAAFYAAHLVAEKLQPRVYVISPSPTPAPTGGGTPPPFFGLKPPRNVFHKIAHGVVRMLVENSTKPGMKLLNELRTREGLPAYRGSVFDLHVGRAKRIYQIGVPGFEYPRTDWPSGFEFIGPLLPHKRKSGEGIGHEEKLRKYPTVIVVSQGTMDNRDPEKLFVPVLEALKDGPHLVIATTGYRNTEALRKRFPQDNVIIEDYLDFDVLLGHADLFICNGGFGSILQALMKGVPLLSAGKLEGKNDINARIDWRGVGIDLRTERPTPEAIASGVLRVLGDKRFAENVARVRAELEAYHPFEIIERGLEMEPKPAVAVT